MATQHQVKRPRFTASDVILALDDADIEDFDEDGSGPMMPGSDDELDDIQWEERMEEGDNQSTLNVIPSSPVMDITPSLDAQTELGSSTSGHQGTPSSGTTACTTHSSSQTTPLLGHATPCPVTHMQWSSSLEPITVAPFSENIGPTFSVPSSPKAVLNHFLTDSICEMVVTQSNLYAQQVMGEEKYEKITVDELTAFFGLRILMGIVKLPAMVMYWTALNQPEITSRISRNRFQDLTRYLHFADNSTLPERGQSGHDRLGKVRPIIDAFQERFLLNYSPNGDQAVYEAMIPFQGRSSLKQYLNLSRGE